jgi:acyl-CoA reductase-like NAD-dependent aldehyde dehydrogenase
MTTANSTSDPTSQNGTPQIPLIINGKPLFTKDFFNVESPISGDVVYKGSAATLSEANMAIEAANAAFPAWRDTPAVKKRDVFLRAAEVMEKRRDELANYMMAETGATRPWADFNLSTTKDFLIDIAGRIGSISGYIPTTQSPNTGAFVFKEPFGVVLGVAPWYVLRFSP